MISLEGVTPKTPAAGATAPGPANAAALRQTAREFEAAFIGEMLRHAGLDQALSSNAGFGGEAFTSILIETYAEMLSVQGGFGLADQIYGQLKEQAQ